MIVPPEPKYPAVNDRMLALGADLFFIFVLYALLFSGVTEAIYGLEQNAALRLAILNNNPGEMIEAGVLPRVVIAGIFQYLVIGAYMLAFWHFFCTTPGKWMMGMRIVDAETFAMPTAKQWLWRYLGYIVFPGILMAILHKRKQALHDRFAKTVVIKAPRFPLR